MASHDSVAEKFGNRQVNSRTKRVEWSASRVYCEDDLIFSYGGHFPMAKYLGEHPKYGHFFIKNSDKFSSSTSAHQSCVRHHCFGPEVSRSHLSKYIHFSDLTMENVYLWRDGLCKWLWLDTQEGVFYSEYLYNQVHNNDDSDAAEILFTDPIKLPRTGKFKAHRKQEYGPRYQTGIFIVEEVLVLKVKDKYLLCTHNSVVELARKPKTISEALKIRKLPQEAVLN